MKTCIYCQLQKEDTEFSLEHVIPRFLGGAYAPEEFKTREVCCKCNNNLGLFVDAAVQRNYLVYNILNEAAYAFFNPGAPMGLPFKCMGLSDLKLPRMDFENEVCEVWLGPLGEQVYWVRPKDERMGCYVGGNPIQTRIAESRAYFFFSERSAKFPILSWLSFKEAFEDLNVKKLMGTIVEGENPIDIGFEEADEIDKERIVFLKGICFSDQMRKGELRIDTRFDLRFLSKTGIGVAYALFGAKALDTDYAEELYKGLWHKPEEPLPQIRGASFFSHPGGEEIKRMTGEEHAVSLIIQRVADSISATINISAQLMGTVQIARCEDLSPEEIAAIGDGQMLIMYRPLKRCIKLKLVEYFGHRCGVQVNEELREIHSMTDHYIDFFKNL